MTAQRKDLSDPDVISAFAKEVKTLERLDYLYLLTISDIRATNTELWNDWKNKLLAELYNKTASALNTGVSQHHDKESNIADIQTNSLRRLQRLGIDSHQADKIWKTFNSDYFQGHTYGQIAWHTSLILDAIQNQALDNPLVKTRVHKSSKSIQLIVYMKDRHRIFYDNVSVLGRSDVDILSAQILKTDDDYSLQTFRLAPSNTNTEEMTIVADEIMHHLQGHLKNDTDVTTAALSGHSRQKFFSSPTVVRYKDSENEASTVIIETTDRSGVLENIAKTFIDCGVYIISARIATAGEKVLDYFTVSNTDEKALTPEQKENLKQHLEEAL